MAPLISTMPALPLVADCTIEWVAIDPSSGADVAGVKIQNPTLYGIDLSGGVGGSSGQTVGSPLFVPIPLEQLTNVNGGTTGA